MSCVHVTYLKDAQPRSPFYSDNALNATCMPLLKKHKPDVPVSPSDSVPETIVNSPVCTPLPQLVRTPDSTTSQKLPLPTVDNLGSKMMDHGLKQLQGDSDDKATSNAQVEATKVVQQATQQQQSLHDQQFAVQLQQQQQWKARVEKHQQDMDQSQAGLTLLKQQREAAAARHAAFERDHADRVLRHQQMLAKKHDVPHGEKRENEVASHIAGKAFAVQPQPDPKRNRSETGTNGAGSASSKHEIILEASIPSPDSHSDIDRAIAEQEKRLNQLKNEKQRHLQQHQQRFEKKPAPCLMPSWPANLKGKQVQSCEGAAPLIKQPQLDMISPSLGGSAGASKVEGAAPLIKQPQLDMISPSLGGSAGASNVDSSSAAAQHGHHCSSIDNKGDSSSTAAQHGHYGDSTAISNSAPNHFAINSQSHKIEYMRLMRRSTGIPWHMIVLG